MNTFNDIKGYENIKLELRQLCDMMLHPEVYRELGASLPRGLLLHGNPGVGKTLMATALINESGRPAFICRKDRPADDFIELIRKTFEQARENAPSIVLLDDMDKYANEDEDHQNCEEYVTVQSCIDETKGYDVLVIATVNDLEVLPLSLYRLGRFDRTVGIDEPRGKDAQEIIEYYLSRKAFVSDVDPTEIARLLHRRSCAELETVINEAGIYAGFERASQITMEHIIRACLKVLHGLPESNHCTNIAALTEVAYHEAGHVVVSEVLVPHSVTLATVRGYDSRSQGLVCTYLDHAGLVLMQKQRIDVITRLGGRASSELRSGSVDAGSSVDLLNAFDNIYDMVVGLCSSGLDRGEARKYHESSEAMKAKQESAITSAAERCYQLAKKILAKNKDFLDAVAAALLEKETLTHRDIQELRKRFQIIPAEL